MLKFYAIFNLIFFNLCTCQRYEEHLPVSDLKINRTDFIAFPENVDYYYHHHHHHHHEHTHSPNSNFNAKRPDYNNETEIITSASGKEVNLLHFP